MSDTAQDDANQRSWREVAGFVGVLAALVVVLWVLSLTSGNGSDTPEPASEEPDEAAEETPTTTQPPEPTPDSDADPTVEAALDPEDATLDDSAEAFSALSGRLTYLGNQHVVTLDLATGSLQRVAVEARGSIQPIAGLVLLADENRTVALLHDEEPPTAVLLASGAQLLPTDEPFVDFWVMSRPDGPRGTVQFNAWQDYGILTSILHAPPGTEAVIVAGSGLLLSSPTGGTFRPTIDGFEAVSDHKILAATTQLRVEQRCDAALSCAIHTVDIITGEATELPDAFVSELARIHISPDGRWLLNDTSPARVLDRGSDQHRLLDGGGYGSPVWSQDSTSVAWLTSDLTPTLIVARMEPTQAEQDWVVVELSGLGVDPAPGSTFLLTD